MDESAKVVALQMAAEEVEAGVLVGGESGHATEEELPRTWAENGEERWKDRKGEEDMQTGEITGAKDDLGSLEHEELGDEEEWELGGVALARDY